MRFFVGWRALQANLDEEKRSENALRIQHRKFLNSEGATLVNVWVSGGQIITGSYNEICICGGLVCTELLYTITFN